MSRLTALLVAAALGCGAASAGDAPAWRSDTGESWARLMHGTEADPTSVLEIVCDPRTPGAYTLYFGFEPAMTREGEPVAVDLFSEAGLVALPGIVIQAPHDEAFFVMADHGAEPLRLIAAGDTLNLMVEDGVLEIPLDAAARAAAAELLAACG
jgi:hypothetical protein